MIKFTIFFCKEENNLRMDLGPKQMFVYPNRTQSVTTVAQFQDNKDAGWDCCCLALLDTAQEPVTTGMLGSLTLQQDTDKVQMYATIIG